MAGGLTRDSATPAQLQGGRGAGVGAWPGAPPATAAAASVVSSADSGYSTLMPAQATVLISRDSNTWPGGTAALFCECDL